VQPETLLTTGRLAALKEFRNRELSVKGEKGKLLVLARLRQMLDHNEY